MQDLNELRKQIEQELSASSDPDALEQWRIKYLGRKGMMNSLFRGLGEMIAEERALHGKNLNQFRQLVVDAFEQRQQALKEADLQAELTAEGVDVTLPGRRPQVGRIHPVSRTLREIYRIFGNMGFQIYTALDVETDEVQLPAAQFPQRTSRRAKCRTPSTPRSRMSCCAPTPAPARSGPCVIIIPNPSE